MNIMLCRIQSILEVQFVGETVEESERYIAYKLQNFISDAGGLLGLFMGCSLISIVEIFYFFINLAINFLFKNPKVKSLNAKHDHEELNCALKKLSDLEKIIHEEIENLQIIKSTRVEKFEKSDLILEEIY